MFSRYSVAALLVVCVLQPCRAELIARDWQTPGDGLLTVDTSTGLEWLDWSVTQLNQFGGTRLEGNRIEDAVPRVLAQLQPGGRFAGFQVGGLDDVTGLFDSAGIPVPSSRFDMLPEEVGDSFRQLTDATPFISYWVSADPNPEFPRELGEQPFLSIFLSSSGSSNFTTAQALGSGDLFNVNFSSVMLFRIPEPHSLALLVTSMAVSYCSIRKRPLLRN